MTMQDDLRENIERLEARMEDLRGRIESCRKTILVARVCGALGAAWIAATIHGFFLFSGAFLLAIAACLGGFVLAGSSTTTRAEARRDLAEASAERDRLIDSLQFRS